MSTRTRYATLALVGLLGACSGSNSDGDSKEDASMDAGAGTDGGDGGGQGKTDGAVKLDAEVDKDTGVIEVDAGVDSGVDSGPAIASYDCPGDGSVVSMVSGGPVASDDRVVTLTIAPNTLATSALITVCKVPAGEVPAAIKAESPVGDVYFIEPGSTAFGGSFSYALDNALLTALAQGADGIAPVVPRTFAGTGAPSASADAVMSLAAKTVTGSVTGSGYVYLRHLDAEGARYGVAITRPLTTTQLTGAVFDLATKVKVLGTPTASRSLAVSSIGCDLEPIEPTGVTQTHGSADCGELETVRREGNAVDGMSSTLAAGRVVDLTDDDATYPPPRFFCKFPGTALARVALDFNDGATKELTVVDEVSVTCKPSLDLVYAANFYRSQRLQDGPIVVSLAPYGVPEPTELANFTSDEYLAELQALGSDGVYFKSPASAPSYGPTSPITLTGESAGGSTSNSLAVAFTGAANPTQGKPDWGAYGPAGDYTATKLPSKETVVPDSIDVQYFPDAGGTLTVSTPAGTAATVSAVPVSALDVQFGEPTGGLTSVSFKDGLIDAVYVRGSTDSQSIGKVPMGDGFVRWLRPSDLPLSNGRRTFQILTPAQNTQLTTAGLPLIAYSVGFLKVTWDEGRKLWPGQSGRVVPVAAGTLIGVRQARIAAKPPSHCPAQVVTDANGCQLGPNNVLLVATKSGVEKFNPVDGTHLGTLIDSTKSMGLDGFVHVVQNVLAADDDNDIDADYCLYASQNTTGHGNGIWRYKSDGSLLDTVADGSFKTTGTPRGIGFMPGSPILAVANADGGVLVYNTQPKGGPLDPYTAESLTSAQSLFYVSERVRIDPNDPNSLLEDQLALYVSDAASGANDGRVRRIPDPGTSSDFLSGLSSPMQISLDAADNLNLLIASFGSSTLIAKSRGPDSLRLRTITAADLGVQPNDWKPMGAWSLLNEKWLVSGTGGVDIVMPGTHVRTLENTSVGDETAAYISSACLP